MMSKFGRKVILIERIKSKVAIRLLYLRVVTANIMLAVVLILGGVLLGGTAGHDLAVAGVAVVIIGVVISLLGAVAIILPVGVGVNTVTSSIRPTDVYSRLFIKNISTSTFPANARLWWDVSWVLFNTSSYGPTLSKLNFGADTNEGIYVPRFVFNRQPKDHTDVDVLALAAISGLVNLGVRSSDIVALAVSQGGAVVVTKVTLAINHSNVHKLGTNLYLIDRDYLNTVKVQFGGSNAALIPISTDKLRIQLPYNVVASPRLFLNVDASHITSFLLSDLIGFTIHGGQHTEGLIRYQRQYYVWNQQTSYPTDGDFAFAVCGPLNRSGIEMLSNSFSNIPLVVCGGCSQADMVVDATGIRLVSSIGNVTFIPFDGLVANRVYS